MRIKLLATATVILAVLVGSFIAFTYTQQRDNERLDDNVQQLIRENSKLRYIHQLAIEFTLDPKIVMAVDHLASEYIDPSLLRYRLLNKELYTYMFLSLIWAESKGDPQAIGDSGKAFGLTQLWLDTAQMYNEELEQGYLLTVQGNLNIAFLHADYLLDKYHGNVALWLYSWNRGEGTVDRLMQYGGAVENGYARRVYLAAELNNRRMDWR